jgi:cyclophilin family peptidyl-prolyl cis-trans isomerase
MMKTFYSTIFIAAISLSATLFAQSPSEKKAPPAGIATEHIVQITTDYGVIKVKLYNETPLHRDNFLKLVKQGYYDDLLFHRVIKNFMIQGGDPDSKGAPFGNKLGDGGPGYNIPAEIVPGKFHKRGALAAAREGDNVNPKKESSGSQFYIVQGHAWSEQDVNMFEKRYKTAFTEEQKNAYKTIGGYPALDNNYTVFGEVIEGLDVLDKIEALETVAGDRPKADVKMKMKVIK